MFYLSADLVAQVADQAGSQRGQVWQPRRPVSAQQQLDRCQHPPIGGQVGVRQITGDRDL